MKLKLKGCKEVQDRLALLRMTYREVFKLNDLLYLVVINRDASNRVDTTAIINIGTGKVVEQRDGCYIVVPRLESADDYRHIELIDDLVVTHSVIALGIPLKVYNEFGRIIKSIKINERCYVKWWSLVNNRLIIFINANISTNIWCIVYNKNKHRIDEYYDRVHYYLQTQATKLSIIFDDECRIYKDYEVQTK